MLRKQKHLRFTRQRIREIRYLLVNHCLQNKQNDDALLRHYAYLIKKYQRRLKWIQM